MRKKIITIVLSAVFSIILWASVSLSDEYFTTVVLPVHFENLSKDYSINTKTIKSVFVSLKGEGWQLASLTFGRELKLDIPVENSVGRKSVSVRNVIEQNSWLTSSVQLVEVNPAKIDYVVEKIKFKRVPIKADIELDFKPGYGIVSGISIDPDSVDISGPESIIRDINQVHTQKISFASLDHLVAENVELEKLQAVSYYNKSTSINFDVQKIVDKTFEDVPVETRDVPSSRSLELFPRKIKITLRGGINMLGKLTEDDLKPYVTFSQALKDTLGAIEPVIDIPEFTRLIVVKPSKLDYIIKQY